MDTALLQEIRHLAKTLGQQLVKTQGSITTVESCTGGGIASAITDISGSSTWFKQAWVTYSNQSKIELVGVRADTLQEFGAVSEQVVSEMVQGAKKRAQADLAIAVSGIAGPSGGTLEKPVGLVWIALATNEDLKTYKQNFSGDRISVRQQAIKWALEKLVECSAD